MKYILLYLFSLCIFFTGFTIEIDIKPHSYVSDFSEMIDQHIEDELNVTLSEYEKTSGIEIALVTIESLDDQPIEDYAQALFNKWCIGKSETNNGLLILVSKKDRKYRIHTGYGLEPYLTDYECKVIGDRELITAFKANDYNRGFVNIINAFITELGSDAWNIREEYRLEKERVDKQESEILVNNILNIISGVFLICIIFLVYFIVKKKIEKIKVRKTNIIDIKDSIYNMSHVYNDSVFKVEGDDFDTINNYVYLNSILGKNNTSKKYLLELIEFSTLYTQVWNLWNQMVFNYKKLKDFNKDNLKLDNGVFNSSNINNYIDAIFVNNYNLFDQKTVTSEYKSFVIRCNEVDEYKRYSGLIFDIYENLKQDIEQTDSSYFKKKYQDIIHMIDNECEDLLFVNIISKYNKYNDGYLSLRENKLLYSDINTAYRSLDNTVTLYRKMLDECEVLKKKSKDICKKTYVDKFTFGADVENNLELLVANIESAYSFVSSKNIDFEQAKKSFSNYIANDTYLKDYIYKVKSYHKDFVTAFNKKDSLIRKYKSIKTKVRNEVSKSDVKSSTRSKFRSLPDPKSSLGIILYVDALNKYINDADKIYDMARRDIRNAEDDNFSYSSGGYSGSSSSSGSSFGGFSGGSSGGGGASGGW